MVPDKDAQGRKCVLATVCGCHPLSGEVLLIGVALLVLVRVTVTGYIAVTLGKQERGDCSFVFSFLFYPRLQSVG